MNCMTVFGFNDALSYDLKFIYNFEIMVVIGSVFGSVCTRGNALQQMHLQHTKFNDIAIRV